MPVAACVADHAAEDAVVAVSPHGLSPPRVVEACLQKATTRPCDGAARRLFSDAIGVRPLRCCKVMWVTQTLGGLLQLARSVRVQLLHYFGPGNEVLEGH